MLILINILLLSKKYKDTSIELVYIAALQDAYPCDE